MCENSAISFRYRITLSASPPFVLVKTSEKKTEPLRCFNSVISQEQFGIINSSPLTEDIEQFFTYQPLLLLRLLLIPFTTVYSSLKEWIYEVLHADLDIFSQWTPGVDLHSFFSGVLESEHSVKSIYAKFSKLFSFAFKNWN